MSFATRSTASAFASTSTPVSRLACSRPVSRSIVVRAQPDTQPAVGGGEKISNTAPAAQEKDTKQTEKPAGSGAGWVQPTLNPDTPSPIFGGSTGGLLRKAQVEEFYVVTWEAKKEAIFEMPTGGAATMRAGANLLKLARKEQCMALTGQLRTKFKIAPCFYRVYPDGKVEYLHPKDGVYPEKVNPGRPLVNCNMRSIGENVNPIKTKFTGKGPMSL